MAIVMGEERGEVDRQKLSGIGGGEGANPGRKTAEGVSVRLRYLWILLALTVEAGAYCAGGWCGPPPGSRERFPRHEICCQNGNCRQCSEGECCPQRPRQTPGPDYNRWGGDCCQPYSPYSRLWGESTELGADVLYWASTRDPIVVWTQQVGNPTNFVRTYELSPGYDWGVRVYGQQNFPCSNWFIRGGYLYLRTFDKARIRSLNILLPWGGLSAATNINAADASLKLHYQRAELVGGYNIFRGRCSNFYAYGGGFWVDLLQKFKSDAHGNDAAGDVSALLNRRTRTQGVGAIVGFGGKYAVVPTVYLLGRLGGMAIAARRQLRWTIRGPAAVQPNGRFEAFYPDNWGLLPGIEASVAARHTNCICGLAISAEIGWEIQHYFNAFRAAIGLPTTGQTTFIDCGFSGPYAGLRLTF